MRWKAAVNHPIWHCKSSLSLSKLLSHLISKSEFRMTMQRIARLENTQPFKLPRTPSSLIINFEPHRCLLAAQCQPQHTP